MSDHNDLKIISERERREQALKLIEQWMKVEEKRIKDQEKEEPADGVTESN
jgi:hypothetical protein